MSQPYIWGTLRSLCTSAMGLDDIQSNVTSPLTEPISFGEQQSMKVTPITSTFTVTSTEPIVFGPSQFMPVRVGPITPTSTAASPSGQLVLPASQSMPVKMGPITQTSTVVSPSGQLVPSAVICDDDDDAVLLSADKINSQNNLEGDPSCKNNAKSRDLDIHTNNNNTEHAGNCSKSDVPLTFSEALEHVSSPSSHSTDGNDASKITEPICTGTNQMTEPTCTKSNQMTEPSINSGTLYKTAEPTCTETNQTNEPSCTETNQMINSGTSPNSVSANNHDLGEKKTR